MRHYAAIEMREITPTEMHVLPKRKPVLFRYIGQLLYVLLAAKVTR